MKSLLQFMRVTLILAFTLSVTASYAQQYTLTDADVEVEEGAIISCSYAFDLKDIIIPQTLDGQTVTAIADKGHSSSGVFESKGIISVELPITMEYIGSYAFSYNDISSLEISDFVELDTIGHGAFQGNELTMLDLSGCTALSIIDAAAFGFNTLSDLDFSGCYSLQKIGSGAFSSNSIETLDLSDCTALATIGYNAFYNNSLVSVDLTGCEGMRFLERGVFTWNNSLSGFHLPEVEYAGTNYTIWNDGEGNSYTAGVDMASNLETFYVPYIPYTLTDDDVEVEEGLITSISYTFELKNIIIPQILDGQTIIAIPHASFFSELGFNNKGITSVVLPTTIETIGNGAFEDNTLLSVDLSGCTALVSIEDNAFRNNYSIRALNLSSCSALRIIGDQAFMSNYISVLDLSDCSELTTIGSGAFSGNSISELNLSGSEALARIGEYAFSGNSLSSLDLTACKGLRMIENAAFNNNASLSGFLLPEVDYKGAIYLDWKDGEENSYTAGVDMVSNFDTYFVPYIPYTLTANDVELNFGSITSCSYDFELKNIIIPQSLDGETVVAIASGSNFSGGVFSRQDIVSVELPVSMKTIGDYAFYENNLSSLLFSNGTELSTIGMRAFSGNKIKSLDFTNCSQIATIGESAFTYNGIENLDLDDCTSLLEIESYAFYSNAISEFNLPDPVIPGYFYSNWLNSDGGMHSGGDPVNNFRIGYKRVMPEINTMDPFYVPTTGNEEITFTGTNFESLRNNKTVLFNGIEALSYTVWNDTMIRVVCPPHPEGAAEVEIVLENDLSYKPFNQLFYSDEDVVAVCGELSGTWETGKTYLLTCRVIIRENKRLIIEEGVRVLAMPDAHIEFVCVGALEVRGTETNPVSFGSANEIPGSWDGIHIGGTRNNCQFNYCLIEHATSGVNLTGWAYACDSEDNYSEFDHCIIRNNIKDGFYCRGEGDPISGCGVPKTGVCSPIIRNCQIYNNGEDGIDLYTYEGYKSNGYIEAEIYNNNIFGNKNGIYIHGSDWLEPRITNNVIAENSSAGIYSTNRYFNTDDFIIANNILIDNEIGIMHNDTAVVVLNNNGFWSNTVDLEGDLQDVSNIFEDPLFMDAAIHDYNLSSGSPCIDAGDNDFSASEYDYNNRARIWDGNNDQSFIIDMGISEFGAPCHLINEVVAICEGESYQFGDSVFKETGTHILEFTDQFGCDSVVRLELTKVVINTEVIQAGNVLTSEAAGADYQWLDCDSDFSIIGGESNQSYSASVNGNYAVEISIGSCVDTSDCKEVTTASIQDLNDFGDALRIYPNPTNDYVTIELGASYKDVRLKIFSVTGQQIWDQKYGRVELIHYMLNAAPGRYLFSLDTGEGKSAAFSVIKY